MNKKTLFDKNKNKGKNKSIIPKEKIDYILNNIYKQLFKALFYTSLVFQIIMFITLLYLQSPFLVFPFITITILVYMDKRIK